jgi:hypothetical protein
MALSVRIGFAAFGEYAHASVLAKRSHA